MWLPSTIGTVAHSALPSSAANATECPTGPEAAGRLLLVTREMSRSRLNATTLAGYSPAAEGKAALLRSTRGNAALLRRTRSAVNGLVRFGKAPHVERGFTDGRGTEVSKLERTCGQPLAGFVFRLE